MTQSADIVYKHQFYIDMKNIDNKSISIESYIQNHFNSFWESFYDYLTVFQKPIPKKFWTNPKDYLMLCLKSATKVIKATTFSNYNPDMKNDITNCFKTLLYPENLETIKSTALEIFMLLYTRTTNTTNPSEYTKDFEQYFFDFSAFDPSLKFDLNEEMRIQNLDQTEQKNDRLILINKMRNFLVSIYSNCFENNNNDMNAFLLWWPCILKQLIGVIYYSILNNKPNDKGVTSLNLLSNDPQLIPIEFLTKISTPDKLGPILTVDKTAECLIDIMNHLTIHSCMKKSTQQFVNSFVNTVIGTNNSRKNFIPIFYKINWTLLLIMIGSILNYLNYFFSLHSESTIIEDITINIRTFFNLIYKQFNTEQKRALCEYFANCTKDKNQTCILHIITLLLSFFAENQIVDEHIWSTFVNREIYGISLPVTLKCYCNFAGYFSACGMIKLIDIDRNSLTNSIVTAPQRNLFISLSKNLYWIKELNGFILYENGKEGYINERSQLIHSSILESPEIVKIALPDFVFETWPKDNILAFSRAMFKSFNWQSVTDDEDIQFLYYLIRASFITPLLRITQVITPDIQYNIKFLLEEFFTFLKSCTDNSNTHNKIKLHALNILGNLVCNIKSLPYMDESLLADWYEILYKCIDTNKYANQAELRMGIKVAALTFACRSIQIGFKGSSILLTTIANNFKLPEQLLTKAASDTTQSYIVDRGCEILTRKELASILLSFCNICEITDIFDFHSNDSKSIKEVRNELKVKLFMTLFKDIEPDLFFITLVSQLSQETESQEDYLIDFLLKQLFVLLGDHRPSNVYSIISILFFLPELNKTKAGSVQQLIDECLNIIDSEQIQENEHEGLFVRFVEFVVDLLIYSSFIIDTASHLQKFKSIISKWDFANLHNNDQALLERMKEENVLRTFSDECKQRLEYAILHLTTHYLRFPPPSRVLSVSSYDTTKPNALFGSTKDCILKVSENSILSTLPVGKFEWTFKSVAPPPQTLRLSDDINIKASLPNPSEFELQHSFTNKMSSFINNLHSNHFVDMEMESDGDVYQVNHPKLWTPKDFLSNQDYQIPTDPEPVESKEEDFIPHKTMPYSVGPNAAAFMSSLNFFDSIQTTRFFPSLSDSLDFQTKEYHHIVHIGFIKAPKLNSPHLNDLIAGLGCVNEKSKNVVYEDCRHKFIFHVDAQQVVTSTIYICWTENLSYDDYNNSLNLNLRLRIDITPTHLGLFNVSVKIPNKIQTSIQLFENVLVSKKVLPVFILSQIMLNTHLIDLSQDHVEMPQLSNGCLIRECRENQFIPPDQLKPLNCEESLLMNSHNQSFDEFFPSSQI